MQARKNGLQIEYFLMLIVSFFWAIGHPVGRILLEKLHPFQVSTVTLGTGFIGLMIFLIITGRIKKLFKLPMRDIFISMGLGVLGFFLYQILTFSALDRIPASMNAVLVSNNVVFIAIFAAIILKERIRLAGVAGIILAVAGVVLVTFNQGFNLLVTFNQGFNLGNGSGNISILGCSFSLLAALSAALYSVIGKKVLAQNDPLIITAFAIFSGTVLLTILTASTVGFSDIAVAGWQLNTIMVVLGLTMIGVAYPLWFICLKKFPASQISIYTYLTPVFAVILSLAILKEKFSWLFWVGGGLILLGIIITNTFSSRIASNKKTIS